MNLAFVPRRLVTTDDRRVLGAFQFVDAVTGVPVTVPAAYEIRRAAVAGQAEEIVLDTRAVRVLQNRRGIYVIMTAPFFERYVESFDNPQAPPETAAGPLGLRVDVTDAGPQYLPLAFRFDLPRSLDPDDEGSVLRPVPVPLFRAPTAPVQDGWAVLRARVVQRQTNPPRALPGVVVRAYAMPRAANDRPIGEGLTDWRGHAVGEAVVPIASLRRFAPGAGPTPVAIDQLIDLETIRESAFTGANEPLNVSRLTTGAGPGLIRATTTLPDPANPALTIIRPEDPLRVQAGREYVVELSMP
jgi:hypothetical protein